MEVIEKKTLKFYANIFPSVPFVFLFSGKAGVGKTYSAGILRGLFDNRGLMVMPTSFASGVKEAARNCFGWDGQKDQRGRKLLQSIGGIGREYDENIWARRLFESYIPRYAELKLFHPDIILIDDWRFPNEYLYIESLGQYIVAKIRINAPSREILKGTEEYNDVSETSLDDYDFDHVINNEGSYQQLEANLLGIYKTYFERG